MKKIKILKPHQNAGIWYTVGQVIEVSELRAKDLIEAGLAAEDVPAAAQTKPRIATQAKPRQSASTKTIAVVEPIKPSGDATGGEQNDRSTGEQSDPVGDSTAQGSGDPTDGASTGADTTNNE